MKFFFAIILLSINLLTPFSLFCQTKDMVREYKYINQDKGTVLFKEIVRNNTISKDSAILTIRIYGLNCVAVKGGPNAAKPILIDGIHYRLNSEGLLQLVVRKGNHFLDLEYPTDSLFSPLKATKLILRRRHQYFIEVYFSIPQKGYHEL